MIATIKRRSFLVGFILFFVTAEIFADTILTLTIIGKLLPHCKVVATPIHGDNLDLSGHRTSSANLYLDCNTPMELHLSAKNGVLSEDNSANLTGQPYLVSVMINELGLDRKIPSKKLKQGVVFKTNRIPFKTEGLLTVQLEKPLIFAGDYRDVLYINVKSAKGFGGI